MLSLFENDLNSHYVKSAQIRSFFWFVFPRIWTEYRELLRKSPYLIRVRENTDHIKTRYLDTFHAAEISRYEI